MSSLATGHCSVLAVMSACCQPRPRQHLQLKVCELKTKFMLRGCWPTGTDSAITAAAAQWGPGRQYSSSSQLSVSPTYFSKLFRLNFFAFYPTTPVLFGRSKITELQTYGHGQISVACLYFTLTLTGDDRTVGHVSRLAQARLLVVIMPGPGPFVAVKMSS